MRNLELVRERYLRDGLATRLGGLASNLARIASCSSDRDDWEAVQSMLEESKFFIEWAVPEAPLSVQAHLARLQIELALWQRIWPQVHTNPEKREKLAQLARSESASILALRE
jgi:hypothetical protein